MPGAVLSARQHYLLISDSEEAFQMGTIAPVLRMRKLSLREVNKVAETSVARGP